MKTLTPIGKIAKLHEDITFGADLHDIPPRVEAKLLAALPQSGVAVTELLQDIFLNNRITEPELREDPPSIVELRITTGLDKQKFSALKCKYLYTFVKTFTFKRRCEFK